MTPVIPRVRLGHRGFPARALGVGSLFLLLGCGGSGGASDKALASMREEISRMRAEGDRVHQRLEALEIALADEKELREKDARARNHLRTSPGRTISLRDEGVPSEDGDADDPSARPEIRVIGSGGARSPRGKSAAVAYVEESPPAFDGGTRPSALDPEAKRAYEAALELVRSKQTDRGLEALTSFLVRWPGHPYAENAMYWRGEAYYARGEFERASQEFEAVVARFTTGAKVPDALLKLGMCFERLGSPARAREAWQRLQNEFPRSAAVKMIPSKDRDAAAPKAAAPRADGSVSKGSKENR